ADRIKEEAELVKKFGLKNKRELWKAKSIVRNLRRQSRNLQARTRTGEEQANLETKNLLARCGKMGLLPIDGTTLDDVLGLNTESVLSRRLQTLVFARGLSNTVGQARQYIVHGHVHVADRMVSIPGYLVTRGEEDKVVFNPHSPISDDLHPMRAAKKKAGEQKPVEAKKPEEEKKDLKVKLPKKLAAEVIPEGEVADIPEIDVVDEETKEGE
ncbi:MAG: 30S ribosomal protein S4, partial [Methanomassiliicoccales archaeon]|nr:30S ribosomal protein S4 [Methanomassiliicoccales archaeon]